MNWLCNLLLINYISHTSHVTCSHSFRLYETRDFVKYPHRENVRVSELKRSIYLNFTVWNKSSENKYEPREDASNHLLAEIHPVT